MVASIKFTAVQSNKYLRITDKIPPEATPTKSKLLTAGSETSFFTVDVETFDENTGLVKVEVSTDNATFTTHDENMRVVHRWSYPIDDSKLPKPKKERPAA
ncbi:hypothetical protein [Mesorhizobium sp.]|uniref:hypothetical protein n=1 Tax=Mesorhizobium sp. TaxID=1871066 RepID=UPI000FEA1F23|nr:hypothetical protein [Mesorhizobium sp.]RWE91724.1 MAG: hypothetical protein EOS43_32095 [Mesorhizobium sp.]